MPPRMRLLATGDGDAAAASTGTGAPFGGGLAMNWPVSTGMSRKDEGPFAVTVPLEDLATRVESPGIPPRRLDVAMTSHEADDSKLAHSSTREHLKRRAVTLAALAVSSSISHSSVDGPSMLDVGAKHAAPTAAMHQPYSLGTETMSFASRVRASKYDEGRSKDASGRVLASETATFVSFSREGPICVATCLGRLKSTGARPLGRAPSTRRHEARGL